MQLDERIFDLSKRMIELLKAFISGYDLLPLWGCLDTTTLINYSYGYFFLQL